MARDFVDQVARVVLVGERQTFVGTKALQEVRPVIPTCDEAADGADPVQVARDLSGGDCVEAG